MQLVVLDDSHRTLLINSTDSFLPFTQDETKFTKKNRIQPSPPHGQLLVTSPHGSPHVNTLIVLLLLRLLKNRNDEKL